jgi:putative redox protein
MQLATMRLRPLEPAMTIGVVRNTLQKMKHTVHVRQHMFAVDEPESNGGEDLGMAPHDVDDSEERSGFYRLRVTLAVSGALTDAQRQELLTVAGKCPVHKLMAQATTEVVTELVPHEG